MPPAPSTRSTRYLPASTSPSRTGASIPNPLSSVVRYYDGFPPIVSNDDARVGRIPTPLLSGCLPFSSGLERQSSAGVGAGDGGVGRDDDFIAAHAAVQEGPRADRNGGDRCIDDARDRRLTADGHRCAAREDGDRDRIGSPQHRAISKGNGADGIDLDAAPRRIFDEGDVGFDGERGHVVGPGKSHRGTGPDDDIAIAAVEQAGVRAGTDADRIFSRRNGL